MGKEVPMDAESNAYKKQVVEAFRKQKEEYCKAQKYFLRPVMCDGMLETPNLGSRDIVKLLSLNGSNTINILDFYVEYERIRQAYIKGMIAGTSFENLPLPKPVEYAEMRDFNIQFGEGDIIKNPVYDSELDKKFSEIR